MVYRRVINFLSSAPNFLLSKKVCRANNANLLAPTRPCALTQADAHID